MASPIDQISFDVVGTERPGCWAKIRVLCGGAWRDAYSPRWGAKIRPEYVAWRVARRFLGEDKPLPEVRKLRDSILAGGLADRAIRAMEDFVKRVEAQVEAIKAGVDFSIETSASLPESRDQSWPFTLDHAFKAVMVDVKVKLRNGSWSFCMVYGKKPSTSKATGYFVQEYWPDSNVPKPIKDAIREVEVALEKKIASAVLAEMEKVKRPGSRISIEVKRRLLHHMFRSMIKDARRAGLMDAEILAAWEDMIVDDIHDC